MRKKISNMERLTQRVANLANDAKNENRLEINNISLLPHFDVRGIPR